MNSRYACILLTLLVAGTTCLAQTGHITVASTPAGAAVYVDSVFAGTTPLERLEVSAGRHTVKVFYPNATSWLKTSKSETIDVADGADSRYTFELGSLLTLNSKPTGATVSLRGRELGVTPLYYTSPDQLSGALIIKKDGYEESSVNVPPDMTFPPLVTLKPLSQDLDEKLPNVLPSEYENDRGPRWATYAAVTSMVVAGVLSAYWKNQANNDFDKFVETGDPALLVSTQKLDHRAGISITVSHISFAALAYLLIME